MLVRFMFGLYRIHQLRRSAVVADDSYQAICRRLARQLDINRPVTVCFSDRVSSPISFGWLSPYILMQRKLNLKQFELVAAHELAHVQRLDWLTNIAIRISHRFYFEKQSTVRRATKAALAVDRNNFAPNLLTVISNGTISTVENCPSLPVHSDT